MSLEFGVPCNVIYGAILQISVELHDWGIKRKAQCFHGQKAKFL